ncbi:MAG: ComEA family DNA-binding protein [Sphaerobacteraceae bacterium]|nr:MAG: ComEA family DNA-binding protein [Sphaerobacteraceae bacterium]
MVVVVVFVVILSVTRSDRSRDLVLQIEPIDSSNDVTVFVGGAVEDPGLYSLPRGSRVHDAIDLAGVLDSADTSALSLASVVSDEQSIIISEQQKPVEATDDDSVPDPGSVGRLSESDSGDRINVNTASQAELQSLPGVGPAIAERIIDHRTSEGLFESIDELSDVSGISDRMVDDLRSLVEVSH